MFQDRAVAWRISSLENAHGWPANSGISTYWQQDPWVLISSLASNLESVTSLRLQMPKWVGTRWGVAGVLLGVSSYPDGRDFTSLHVSGLKGKISQGQGQGCLGLTSTGCPSLLFQVTRRCTSFPKKPHCLAPVCL